MDIKPFIANTQAAIIEHWGSIDACPHNAHIFDLVAQLQQLKPALKNKKQAKQECAKQFGAAKAEGGDIAALKQQMQGISDELAALEMQRKTLEAQLLELLEKNTQSAAEFPARFSAQEKPSTTSDICTIAEIQSENAEEWDRYVTAQPRASFYHRYRWREIITKAFGHDSYYFVARDNTNAVRGVLPIVRLKSFLFGDFGVSLPFFNYGGVLADNAAIAKQLLQHGATRAQQIGMRHLEIRSTQSICDWPARTDKVSMILKLPGSSEQLDRQIGSKVRAQIKRAQQENPITHIGHLDLLDDFYRVFARNMRDLGTPVYAKRFFRIILENWPEQSHIVILRMNKQPVAAAFLLGDRDMMEIPWASTLRPANALNMNMLLYWEVLKFTIERGYCFFDFGRSTVDSGTFRFKKQWGAQPLQHHWHYWLAQGGELPALKPDSPKFRMLIRCWQHLPVPITRLIGPPIVQYLP